MKKLEYNHVKQQFEKFGYKLLSKKYKNNRTKILVKCSFGHQYEITYDNFQKGNRCPICYNKLRGKNQEYTHNFIKKQFAEKGYKLISRYKNSYTKNILVCPKEHQYEVIYRNFQQGQRCPICHDIAKHSRSEKDCLNVVKQILPNENIIENNRTQIVSLKTDRYLELDIWIPRLKKAIEFNGEYWHSSRKSEDNQKVKQCKEKNIDLLIIWYRDWINSKEVQIEKIKNFLK